MNVTDGDGNFIPYTVTLVAVEAPYSILEGANQTVKNDGTDVVIKVDANIDEFVSIMIDGELVDASDYALVSGSTIITLNGSYVSTLALGQHTVDINFTDGTVSTTLTVVEDAIVEENIETALPNTGDATMTHTYIALLGLSVLAVVAVKKKKISSK